jgi:NRPS condensation-like uncharacterized protein
VLDPGVFSRIKRWCAGLDAKVNDFLMTAIAVAIHRWNRGKGRPAAKYLPVVFAADMRQRYAPLAGPVANLSSAHRFWLRQDEIGSFEHTAARVKKKIDGMKRMGLGLDGIAAILCCAWLPGFVARFLFGPLFKHLAHYLSKVSGLTNIGLIPDCAGAFGSSPPATRCSILVPVFPADNLLFAATTFKERITLEMGYDGCALSDESASAFEKLFLETVEEGLDSRLQATSRTSA